jgi:hypothetical protein
MVASFPPPLVLMPQFQKPKGGGLFNHTKYHYLDAVHMDISFGDCVSVSRYCYALILVDRATEYNWTFGFKTLSLADILYLHSISSMLRLVCWHVAFTQIVI